MRLPFISNFIDDMKIMRAIKQGDKDELSRLFHASISPFEIIPKQGKVRPTNYEALIKRNTSWVYVATEKNSSTLAGLPLRLFATTSKGKGEKALRVPHRPVSKRHLKHLKTNPLIKQRLLRADDVQEVTSHQLLDLLDNPNPHMDGFTLKKLMVIYLELTGDNFIQKIRNSLGVVEQLWRLPSQWTWVVPDVDTFIKGYLFGKRIDRRVPLEPEEVIHTTYPHPNNIYYGLSPLEAAIGSADQNLAMKEYNQRLLENDGRPDFLVIRKDGMNDGIAEKLRKDWRRLQGGRKKGSPVFLGGNFDVKDIGFSPREMNFLQGLKNVKEEIAAAYGVPVSMLTSDNVNLANAQAGLKQYMKFTILPRARMIENSLNHNLTVDFDSRLFLAFDNPVPEDKEERRAERESNLKSGYSSINIERQKDNEEPVPWGNVPILPFNVAPLGTTTPSRDDPDQEPEKQVKHNCHDSKRALEPMTEIERKLNRIMIDIMERQEKEVLRLDMFKAQEDVNIDWEKWAVITAEETNPVIFERFQTGGNAALRDVGAGIGQWVERPESVQWLKDHIIQFSQTVTATTERQLRNSLAVGINNGESIADLKKRVGDQFIIRKNQAELIARTEANRAANGGQISAWKTSGVVEALEWSAFPDSCVFCKELNGKIVSMDGVFVGAGESVNAVRDGQNVSFSSKLGAVEAPPLHPNDRCTLIPVIKEIELQRLISERKTIKPEILKASLLYHAKNKNRRYRT